jgi:hypothetical protein
LPNVKNKTPASTCVADLDLGRRRTKRMALSVSLEVSGEDLQGAAFRLTATATNLNRDGGMLRLNRDLSIGSTLLLKHRSVRASARVVKQASAAQGQCAYGVELIESEESKSFWGIHFPSAQHSRK